MSSDRIQSGALSPYGWRGLGRASLLLFALGLLAGCEEEQARAPTHPVQGTVLFNGRPAPGAFLVLHPKTPIEPAAPNPTGYVDKDGKFVLSTYGGNDGAPAGEYDVAIKWYKLVQRDGESAPGPNALPHHYSDPKQSKLKIEIVAGKNELAPIKLKR